MQKPLIQLKLTSSKSEKLVSHEFNLSIHLPYKALNTLILYLALGFSAKSKVGDQFFKEF